MRVSSLLILPTSGFANPIDILARAFEIGLNGGWWLNGSSEKMSEWQAGEASIGALERMQKLIKVGGKHHES
jgi:hypothetical protein